MTGQDRIQLVTSEGRWGVSAYYDPNLLPKLRSLPGARWDRSLRVWFVDTSDDSLLDLIEGLNGIGCPVPKELLDRAARVAEKIDAADQVALERASDARLYPFQSVGVRWFTRRVTENKNAFLTDEMGLGKTVQALMALPEGAPVLVVCPACIKGVWKNEAAKWRPEYKVETLKGRGNFRWPEPGEIVVINYDILPAPGEIRFVPPGTVMIGDEIHLAKSRRAQRTIRFKALSEAVQATGGSVWGLTGTPLLNRPPELFQVLDNLGLVAESFGTFKSFYYDFNARPGQWGTEWGMPKPCVSDKLSRVMLRRERSIVLEELPDKTWTEMGANGMSQAVEDLCDEALAQWEEYADEVSSSRGLPPFEMMSHVRQVLAQFKIPFVLDLVEHFEEAEEPVVVFSAHRAPVEELGKREGWEIIVGGTPPEKRTEIVERFQAGELKGLAATIKAGGVGLTLTRAHQMIFVDLEWTPALNTQAEDRICRIGQKNACQYLTVVASHPLDARLTQLLQEKTCLIDATIKHGDVEVRNGSQIIAEAVEAEAVSEAVEIDAVECPSCRRRIQVRTAGQKSKHPGWKYMSCACGEFQWVEGDVSAEDKERLTSELFRLLEVCDGAVSKDNMGFNATDAWVARQMASSIREGFEIDWVKLDDMLRKYRKTQLEAI